MLYQPHYYVYYQLYNDTHNYECHYLFNFFPHSLNFKGYSRDVHVSPIHTTVGLTFFNATQLLIVIFKNISTERLWKSCRKKNSVHVLGGVLILEQEISDCSYYNLFDDTKQCLYHHLVYFILHNLMV